MGHKGFEGFGHNFFFLVCCIYSLISAFKWLQCTIDYSIVDTYIQFI
jgi:hypothetical protein